MFAGKKVYDITRPLKSGITVWPGDSGVKIVRESAISEGKKANVTHIKMSVHTGTHMDAPLHFIDGSTDIARMDLDKLMGEVLVIEARSSRIDAADIEGYSLEGIDAVFFKTAMSSRDGMEPFFEEYPSLTLACARLLTQMGIKTIGTDYFSIESYHSSEFDVHKHLLSNKTAIVENLCLTGIEPGRYSFICLPLKIEGSDGSPCRALLFK